MIQITAYEYLNLIDALHAKGILPFKSGDRLERDLEVWNANDALMNLYKMFIYRKPITANWFKGFLRHQAYFVLLYYMGYMTVYGKEPFSLVQELYNNVQVGTVAYRRPPYMCISKKILKGNKLKVELMYFHPTASPTPYPKITKVFNLNIANKNIISDVYDYDLYFSEGHEDFNLNDYETKLIQLKKGCNAALKQVRKFKNQTK